MTSEGSGDAGHQQEPGLTPIWRDRQACGRLRNPADRRRWVRNWLDATYIKARRDHHIVSVAVIVAEDANTDSRREVLGMTNGHSEAEPFWVEFLRSLARRGLGGAKLVISDAHEGLKAAITKVLGSAADQTRPSAPKLPALMDEAEGDVLDYGGFPAQHRVKAHPTNPIERLTGKIERCSNVVGIFPNEPALTRLISAILSKQNDEWAVQRASCMTMKTIGPLSNDLNVGMPALAA